MSTTTKRKRADVSAEDPATCLKKMKHIENDKGAFEIMSLPDELQLQVLVHAPFEHLPQLRLFIKLMLPIPNVDSNLLIGILKLNRGPVRGVIRRDPKSISNRSNTLELVTSTWPRASWEALRNRTLRCRPYFRTNDERTHLQHLWHLRLLGINGFAALQRLSANVLHYFLDPMLRHLEESDCRDPILMQMLPKTKLLVELCKIDEDIGLLCFFNQFLFDQEKIKNALIKANKDPGEMKCYSSLLF